MKSIYTILLILLSFSAGAQWVKKSFINQENLTGIYFNDRDTLQGVVLSQTSIYETSNGGSSWNEAKILNNASDSLTMERALKNDVYFVGDAFFVSAVDTSNNNGYLFKKSSSNTWSIARTEIGKGIYEMDRASGDLWAVGDSGLVIYTSDTGRTWRTSSPSTQANFRQISAYWNGNIYAFNDSILMRKPSGSFSWSNQYYPIKGYLDFEVFGNNQTMAITRQALHGNYANTSQAIIPFPLNARSLTITGTTPAFMGTDSGIYVSRPVSNYWELMPSSKGLAISDIHLHYNSISLAYAVGDSGLILKNDNRTRGGIPIVHFSGNGGCKDSLTTFVNGGIFGSPYSHTWKLNGQVVSNSFNFDSTFTTTGTHFLTLIADNGTFVDSLSTLFSITITPDTSLNVSQSDSMLCKEGSVDITIQNSEMNTAYALMRVSDDRLIANVSGTGGSIVLNTRTLTDTTRFYIRATRFGGGCEAVFPDTIFVGVEKTEARFNSAYINAAINENIQFYNYSKDAIGYVWNFGNKSNNSSSSAFQPSTSYHTIGRDTVRLIAISALGCRDSLEKPSSVIYDPSQLDAECWAMNFDGTFYDSTYQIQRNSGRSVYVTKNQDLIITGAFGESTFKSQSGSSMDSVPGSGYFIARYTNDGVLKWVLKGIMDRKHSHHNSRMRYNQEALNVVEDRDGNLYVAGNRYFDYLTQRNLDDTLEMNWLQTGYVSKLDSNGVIQWTAGTWFADVYDVAVDDAKNVYAFIFAFDKEMYFSASGDTFLVSAQSSGYLQLVVKYDSVGNVLWTSDFKYAGNGSPGKFECDESGNLYAAMLTSRYAEYTSPQGTTTPLRPSTVSGSQRILIKLDSSGTYQWKVNMNANNPITGRIGTAEDLHVSKQGNIIVGLDIEADGTSQSTVTFESVSQSDRVFNFGDYVLASYSPNGNFNWAAGNRYHDASRISLNSDRFGNIYVCGDLYKQTPNQPNNIFISGTGSMLTWEPVEGSTFMLKYDPAGNLLLHASENGLSGNLNQRELYAKGIAADDLGNIFLIGKSTTLGPPWPQSRIIATDSISAIGEDAFFAKFNASACLSYSKLYSPSQTLYQCEGDQFKLAVNAINTVNLKAGNQFRVEYTDQPGIYGSNSTIGTKVTVSNRDSVLVTIPTVPQAGTYYYRIVTSNPVEYSREMTLVIHKRGLPISSDINLCSGDSTQLTANSGRLFAWSPQTSTGDSLSQSVWVKPKVNTTFQVEVRGSCPTVVDTFRVSVLTTYRDTLPDTTICMGDTLQFFNQSIHTAGFHTQNYPSADGCDSSFTILVNTYPEPSVNLNAFQTDSLCNSASPIPLPSGQPAGGKYSGKGVSSNQFNPNGLSGKQWVTYTITDSQGCSASDSTEIVVHQCVGINQGLNRSQNVLLYPNPVRERGTLEFNEKFSSMNLRIYDLEGKEVFQQEYQDANALSFEANFPSGEYLGVCFQDEKVVYRFRFVKL